MQTLPKSERLCSRKQIAALLDKGTVLFLFPFKIYFNIAPSLADESCCQILVNVPKYNFKRAVARNLLKRRMREAFRKNKTNLYDTLKTQNKTATLFFHYVSPDSLTYDQLESSMQKALAKLANIAAENIDSAVCNID